MSTVAGAVKMADVLSKFTDKYNKFQQKMKQNQPQIDQLWGKVINTQTVKQLASFFASAINSANEQIRAEQRLQNIMGNINGMTQDGIDFVKQRAVELEKTTAIASDAGISGQSELARYVYDPNNIADMTQAMYDLATATYGVNISQEQMMQTATLMGKIMRGDINALTHNGMKVKNVFTEAELHLLRTGTEAERAALVIEKIGGNLAGLSQAMGETPEGTIRRFINALDELKAKIGNGIIRMIEPFIIYIMDNMPKIEKLFLDVFGSLMNILEIALSVATNIMSYMINNWSWIEPLLWGLVSVAVALRAATAAQAIFNIVLRANPILIVIAVIAALIGMLVHLWTTNDNFAIGFMRAWNNILNFFDQVSVIFVKIMVAIVNAFMDMRMKSQIIVEQLINTVIDGINKFIDALNKIPGVAIKTISHVNMTSKENMMAAVIREVGNIAIQAMENHAQKKKLERDQRLQEMIDKSAEKQNRFGDLPLFGEGTLPTGMWDVGDGRLPDIGKVKEVEKIRDTVDISSEDLKFMRELAEMKSIQNFVSLTPTVHVQTGDIQKEADIDTIISRIENALTEQITSSAQGVYDLG